MPELIEWIIIAFVVFLVVVIVLMLYGMIIIGDEEGQHDQDKNMSVLWREWKGNLSGMPWNKASQLWKQEVPVS